MAFWWKSKYSDGTELTQFPEGGGENKYADIDRARLDTFEVWENDALRLACRPEPAGTLIYRRRNTIKVSNTGKVERQTAIVVGWKRKEKGRRVQAVAVVHEGGHIELGENFDPKSDLMYEPKLHPGEGEEI